MPGPLYPLQPTFTRGEISPRLFSRVDVDHWRMALAKCLNWFVLKQGGLRRRPGTEWINYVRTQTGWQNRIRLVRFVFSTVQAYVCEFGWGYIRFYANGGIVNKGTSNSISFVGGGSPTINWPGHALAVNDIVQFSTTGTLPSPLVVGGVYQVSAVGTNVINLSDGSGGNIAISTSGTGTHSAVAPVEVYTPYTIDDVWKLQFTQSADVLYMASTEHPPMMLSRLAASVFQIVQYNNQDGPYLGENTTPTTLQPSGTTGSVNVFASSTTGINGGAGFVSSDANRDISLQYSSKWYWLRIQNYVSPTQVTAYVMGLTEADGTVVGALPGTAATGGWKLGAWCETTGWPGCVAFYQQRLVWGRTDTQPQTVWLSKAGVLDKFSTTVPLQDDDGITLTILAGEVNAITWIAEGSDLLVGTTGAMRTIGPADSSKNFSAVNVMQKRQSTFGSLPIQPVQIGEVAIYASYYGLSLREFMYSFQNNSYISPELTILAEHLLRAGIATYSFAQDRDSIIWIASNNGELLGLTYERDQQIVAMTRHRLGGYLKNSGIVDPENPANPDTPYGVVESVTTIPGADRSEVWVSVRRTINGVETRYVERLTKPFEGMRRQDAVFVDSSFMFKSNTATNQLVGLQWLRGQTVSILAAGAVLTPQVVDAQGKLTLPGGKKYNEITFGINYMSQAVTLPIAQGQPDGTGLGRRKNIIQASIDCMETGYLEVGSPSAREAQVKVGLRGTTDPMDVGLPLHDGMAHYRFDRSWRDLGQVVMQTDKPLPATIRSVTPEFDAEP